jgi:hypothetical protein
MDQLTEGLLAEDPRDNPSFSSGLGGIETLPMRSCDTLTTVALVPVNHHLIDKSSNWMRTRFGRLEMCAVDRN